MLWTIQRKFFDAAGASAWTTGGVPHYITTNPYIGRAYARTVFGFLRAMWSRPAPARGRRREPLIVELGAGSGQFAFNFLRALESIRKPSTFADRSFTYVMTDFTAANVEFWRHHPSLEPHVQAGRLDFATFDASAPDRIHLEVAEVDIGGKSDRGRPVVVIANYVLDSVPQDLLTNSADGLVENTVTITSTQPEPDLCADGLLYRIALEWTPVATSASRYADDDLDALVDWYVDNLFGSSFLLPVVAVRCMEFFRTLTGGPMFALIGDRGYRRLSDLLDEQGPQVGLHGRCFSLPVNFHALGLWAERHGGQVLGVSSGDVSLNVTGLLCSAEDEATSEVRLAFTDAIEEAGPDDFYALKQLAERSYDDLSLDEALALLRWSAWDPVVLASVLSRLIILVEGSPETEFADVRRALRRVWEAHYPLPQGIDVAFNIATLLYGMEYYADAIEFLEHSLELSGPHSSTYFNLGMAHYHLHQLHPAAKALEQSLELAPDFADARSMSVLVAAALSADG